MLGLLIVLTVGIDEPPRQRHVETTIKTLPLPTPKEAVVNPAAPVEALKKIEVTPTQTVSPSRRRPVAPEPQKTGLAWERFAAVHGPVLGRPMIAVIIDDMGLDRKRSDRAVQLPGPLTASFLTYARSLKNQAEAARAGGHEVLIHVPMQPDDSGTYAGPKAFRRDLSDTELQRRIDWALGRLDAFVGINNHMGSRFTTHAPGMALVLAEVKRRGLLFIDSRTSPNSVAGTVARQLSVPFAARDVFIDDDPSRESVVAKLMELEQVATRNGYAIGIGHPYDSTLSLLAGWIPTLASRGFVLVPVSAIVRRREEAG